MHPRERKTKPEALRKVLCERQKLVYCTRSPKIKSPVLTTRPQTFSFVQSQPQQQAEPRKNETAREEKSKSTFGRSGRSSRVVSDLPAPNHYSYESPQSAKDIVMKSPVPPQSRVLAQVRDLKSPIARQIQSQLEQAAAKQLAREQKRSELLKNKPRVQPTPLHESSSFHFLKTQNKIIQEFNHTDRKIKLATQQPVCDQIYSPRVELQAKDITINYKPRPSQKVPKANDLVYNQKDTNIAKHITLEIDFRNTDAYYDGFLENVGLI